MKYLIILFSMVLALGAQAAEVNVSATVDRNSLNPEDTLTLTVTVQGSGGDLSIGQPSLPHLTDFEILNEWNSQSQQATMVATPSGPQFKRVSTTGFNFMLLPKRQGQLTIGAVEVVVDGHAYNTKPITVKVAPGAGGQARPRGGGGGGASPPPGFLDEEEDDLFSQLLRRNQLPGGGGTTGSRTLPINPQDAFFIQADADKTEVYAGEQVTVSFYLYTRGLIRDLDTLKYPSLKGFWKEDIEIASTLNFQTEVVNGIPYKKALLASYALFPIKEGTATIDSYKVKASVASDGFGFGKTYSFTKVSKPTPIKVKPIPADGRPSDFSGAVGEFQVTARIEDRVITENQPITLKIRYEGRGNAKLIDFPPLEFPQGLELYDQQNEARFFRTGNSYKEFRVLLIPRREGDFAVPPISVSIFDPVTGKFEKKNTDALNFHAGKGTGGGKTESSALPEDKNSGAAKVVKAEEGPELITAWRDRPLLSGSARLVVWVAIYVALLGILMWLARIELGWGQKKKDLMRRLKIRLRKIDALNAKGDWRAVGTETTNTLYFVLGAISGQKGASMELEKLLAQAPPSVRRELGAPLAKQLETFQMLTFAPEAVVDGMKSSFDLKAALKEMEALLTKAVSLGLSSEQSNESGSGPRAS